MLSIRNFKPCTEYFPRKSFYSVFAFHSSNILVAEYLCFVARNIQAEDTPAQKSVAISTRGVTPLGDEPISLEFAIRSIARFKDRYLTFSTSLFLSNATITRCIANFEVSSVSVNDRPVGDILVEQCIYYGAVLYFTEARRSSTPFASTIKFDTYRD